MNTKSTTKVSNNILSVDDETIDKVGLTLSEKPTTPHVPTKARVFEYPYLKDVFVMETDLYGNPLPKDYCFLAFYGHHGLMGNDLKVETLRNAKVADIKKIVEDNVDG